MGRDVNGKNQGMDGAGSADPGKRMTAEERAMEERTTDERTMENIIKDATDRYLDSFPEKEITVSDLEGMVSRHDRKVRKRAVRAAGIAALFVIVVAGIFFVSGGYFDAGADKNPKEQIVKDDTVVSKDGGYGDDGGKNELVVTEWDEIEEYYKKQFPKLIVPTYIPNGYKFEKLTIQEDDETFTYKYLFESDKYSIEVHEYYHVGNLESMEITDYDKKLNISNKDIYVKYIDNKNKATIQFDDGVVVEIWSTLSENELAKFANGLVII